MRDLPEQKSNKNILGVYYVSLFIVCVVSGGWFSRICMLDVLNDDMPTKHTLTTGGEVLFALVGALFAFELSFIAFKFVMRKYDEWKEVAVSLFFTFIIATFSGPVAIILFHLTFITFPRDIGQYLWIPK
jgi:hypothetical protein